MRSSMMRNQLYFICIVFVISFAFTINTVQAERNVKDCLETDEDCLELEEEGLDEDNLIEQNETASSNQTGSLIVNMLKIVFALADRKSTRLNSSHVSISYAVL